MMDVYEALKAGDSHDDVNCPAPDWSPWGWVVSYSVLGRICGRCRHWQFDHVQSERVSA